MTLLGSGDYYNQFLKRQNPISNQATQAPQVTQISAQESCSSTGIYRYGTTDKIKEVEALIQKNNITAAIAILEQMNITPTVTEDNGTTTITFKYNNCNYSYKCNPASENIEAESTNEVTSSKTNGVGFEDDSHAGINYNRYEIKASSEYYHYNYSYDSPNNEKDTLIHTWNNKENTINLKDIYKMVTQGKIDELISFLLEKDFNFDSKNVETPDGIAKEITITAMTESGKELKFTISYNTDYSKNIPYPEGVTGTNTNNRTEQQRIDDIIQNYQDVMDSFPDWTPELIGLNNCTCSNYRSDLPQTLRPEFLTLFGGLFTNSYTNQSAIDKLSQDFTWNIEQDGSCDGIKDICERYLARTPDSLDYVNAYSEPDGIHSYTSIFENALMAACGVKMGDSVDAAVQKVLKTLKQFISGHTNHDSAQWKSDEYSAKYTDLLEFVMGKNDKGINYIKNETQEWFNCQQENWQRKFDVVGQIPGDKYMPLEKGTSFEVIQELSKTGDFDFSHYSLCVSGETTNVGYNLQTTDINYEAEAILPQVQALIRQGLWADAADLLRSVGVEPELNGTNYQRPNVINVAEYEFTSAVTMRFKLNGLNYTFWPMTTGYASWEDYQCDISTSYITEPIGDGRQRVIQEYKYLGQLDDIASSDVTCYDEIKTILDTIRQGNYQEALRLVAEGSDNYSFGISPRDTDYALGYVIEFTYKGYDVKIHANQEGWFKDPSSTPNCNAYGQAINGVPEEYRSYAIRTNAVTAFGTSSAATTTTETTTRTTIDSPNGTYPSTDNISGFASLGELDFPVTPQILEIAQSYGKGGIKVNTSLPRDEQIKQFLEGIKGKYDESIYSIIQSYFVNVSYNLKDVILEDGIFNGINFISNTIRGYNSFVTDQELSHYIYEAAGVTENDKPSERLSKVETLLSPFKIDNGNPYDYDLIKLFNYMLGDNSQGTNYFALQLARSQAEEINNQNYEMKEFDVIEPNTNSTPNVATSTYSPTLDVYAHDLEVDEAYMNIKEISDYIYDLLEPIYCKYYESSYDIYTNLEVHPDNDPDSETYQIRPYKWKNQEIREECADAVKAAMQKVYEKYSDILTSLVYDGQVVLFTTIYDNEQRCYQGYNKFSMIPGARWDANERINTLIENGTIPEGSKYGQWRDGNSYHIVIGNDHHSIIHETYQPSSFDLLEPAIDKPIIYGNIPQSYSNIPENPPAGPNVGNVIKTHWDGMYISDDARHLYIWDSKNQNYIDLDIERSDHNSISDAWINQIISEYVDGSKDLSNLIDHFCKSTTKIKNTDICTDLYRILMSIKYGFNRTDCENIYEKDGKYYVIPNGYYKTLHTDVPIDVYAELLTEAEFANGGTASSGVSGTANNTQSTTQTDNSQENNSTVTNNGNTPSADDKTQTNPDKKDQVALEKGYTLGFDNIYHVTKGDNIYKCVWNPWNEKFVLVLEATIEPEEKPELDSNNQALMPTLDATFAEAQIAAEKQGLVALDDNDDSTDDLGIYKDEKTGETYVYDIINHKFVTEKEALKNDTISWQKIYIESIISAIEKGYTMTSAFLFKDNDGNKYRYDYKEHTFVKITSAKIANDKEE